MELASRYNDVGDAPTVEDAEKIIGPLRERFEAGELDQVLLVSAEFRSALSTPPQVRGAPPHPASGGGCVCGFLHPFSRAPTSS